eukprot:XP_017945874.1 PREDICTED: protocadherin-16 [Xenopus tropicalis]
MPAFTFCLLLLLACSPSWASLGTLELHIDEEQPAGTIIGDISAGLPPGSTGYMFFISAQEGSGVSTDLDIDENTGIIKTAKVLDREKRNHYSFIAVTPEGTTVEVDIHVDDINDHSPTFSKGRTELSIPEHTPLGTRYPVDPAMDSDSGVLSTQGYLIRSGDPLQKFRLETRRVSNGVLEVELVVSSDIDRENQSSYSLVLEAYDGGSPTRSSQMRLDIVILDINDHAPVFNQSRYQALISESLLPGASVLQVYATDADQGPNGDVRYEINRRQSDPEGYFTINAQSGLIQINKPLDYETRKVHELVVQAKDGAEQPEVGTAFVSIQVRDSNDNQPSMTIIFLSEDGAPRVSEGANPGQYVARISVSDPDYGEHPDVDVSLEGGEGKFALTTKDSIIYLICVDKLLDREERDSYRLRVLATDAGTPPLRAESSFVLEVTDVNDNPPVFDRQEYSHTVPEAVHPGSFLLQVTARDRDQGVNGEVRYSLLPTPWFNINPDTGVITTAAPLDYEQEPHPKITVVASDQGQPSLSSTALVRIHLLDVNDNEPIFSSPVYNATLSEGTARGSCFLQVSVTWGCFLLFSNSVTRWSPIKLWTGYCAPPPIHSMRRCMISAPPLLPHGPLMFLMKEQVYFMHFTLLVTPFTAFQVIPASRYPSKSNPSSLVLSPMEGLAPGSLLGSLAPRMPHGSRIYTLLDEPHGIFMVDGQTGSIFLVGELDFESQPRFSFRVSVEEVREASLGYVPPHVVHIEVEVQDRNDHSPAFPEDPLTLVVPEDAHVGSSVFTFQASDHDGPGPNSQVRYSLLRQDPGSPGSTFRLDAETGVLYVAQALDREEVSSYLLVVEASDQAVNVSQQRSTSVTARVFISDRNDHAPQFITPLVVWLPEDLPVGSTAIYMVAQDPDLGDNGKVGYQLVGGNDEGKFQLHPSSGALTVVRTLDRETTEGYNLTVVAMDHGSPRLSSTQTLSVSLLDVNDEAPSFEKPQYDAQVQENQPVGTTVLRVVALDRDLGQSGRVTYGGVSGDEFALDPETGVLTTKVPLDREAKELYKLTVYARDGGSPPRLSEVGVQVRVGDENDHPPTFERDLVLLEVPENQEPMDLCVLSAWDPDGGENGRLKYRLIEGDPSGDFTLDSANGKLSTSRPLDRETTPKYQLVVSVSDGGAPPLSATAMVNINVLDLNDNTPAFSASAFSAEVPEDAPVGSLVLHLSAVDPDDGPSGQTTYHLSNGTQGAFYIDPLTGRITTATQLDRERRASYTFLVWAIDSDPVGPRSAEATVTVLVRDVNDNAPAFLRSPFHLNLSRNTPTKRAIAAMKAEDKDAGANASILYRLAPASATGGFSVDPYTGEVRLLEPLSGMSPKERTVFVQATDLGEPPLSSTAVLVVHLREEAPQGPRFPQEAIEISLPENSPEGSVVGTATAAHTGGSTGRISYSFLSGNENGALRIHPTTGQITVAQAAMLDYEQNPRHKLVLQAETQQHLSFATLTISLLDLNDNAPRFKLPRYTAYTQEAQPDGSPLIQVLAEDPDQGLNGQVTYSFDQSQAMKDLFRIDPQTGAITTAAILDREIWSQAHLVVIATDRGSPPLTSSATLTVLVTDVNDNSPTTPLQLELSVPEDAVIGSEILQVTGNDVDSGPALSYTLLVDGAMEGAFTMLRYGGQIWLSRQLDYEDRKSYSLTVQTSDGKHLTHAELTLTLQDVNDNSPEFGKSLYQVSILEHAAAGTPLFTVRATDRDSGDNGRVSYRVLSPVGGAFHIHPDNGTLFANKLVELDPQSPLVDVLVEARDHGSPSLASLTTVQFLVVDANDHSPTFSQSQYSASVPEDLPLGSTVLILEVTDADFTQENAALDYTILSGNTDNAFQVQSGMRFWNGRFQQIGSIILTDSLDFEAISFYNLTLGASDRGVPQRSHSVPVLINVLDINDNPPVFPRPLYSVLLSEEAPVGSEVLRVLAQDSDSGSNGLVHYSITSGDESRLFQINEATGAIRLARHLDRERQALHALVVLALDGQGGQANFALVPVTIEVRDINDNKPYFPVQILTTSIRENQPANTPLTKIHAIDLDTGVYGQLFYTMLDLAVAGSGMLMGKDMFVVNRTSGELRSKQSFDYERIKVFNMVVKAMDAGNFSATVTVQVLVTGEDEYNPVFISPFFNFEVPEGAVKGESLGHVQATDEDEGADGVVLYSFSKPSPYFGINETTGNIYLKTDSQRHRSGRSKRETREMTLEVHAHSPLPSSRVATAQVTVDVTHTSFGLAPDLNLLLVVSVASSLAVVVVLAVVAIVLVICRSRGINKKQQEDDAQLDTLQRSTLQRMGHDKSTLSSGDRIYHQALPGYTLDSSVGDAPYTRGGSLDPSHSSGRGSAEAAEDDEIRMINEYPRVASITSSMQEHISARGPDSGIQQDADQLSDISCDPSMDTEQWFKSKKGSSQSQIYRDDGGGGGAFVGMGCGLNMSHHKDYSFPEDGKPSVEGSLTAIVASDEELRGSYNWDYLLNWCPQFQPLASVFMEIARLKDESALRRPFQLKPKSVPQPRIDPPPLITSVAHPGAKTVPPKPAVVRAFPNFSSLRRSPITNEASLTSSAIPPSFSPSLSPLAARSPVVSPFGISQGPTASVLSTEHNLDPVGDGELRI